MTSYVGLDISLKSTSICVVNADGEVTSEHTVASDPDTIAHFVYANASGVKRIGLAMAGVGKTQLARCLY